MTRQEEPMGIKANKVTKSTFLPMFPKNIVVLKNRHIVLLTLLIKMDKKKFWEYFYL